LYCGGFSCIRIGLDQLKLVGQTIRKGDTAMSRFEQHYDEWLQEQIHAETGAIRLELLQKGLGHGTREFLRSVWFPAIGNFNHLFPEWEVRDFNNGYRYWIWRICQVEQKAESRSRASALMPEIWMSEDSKTCADGIVCWHWMAGPFCPSHTRPSPKNRSYASSWCSLLLADS
jgi:hypothetical protein